MRKISILIIEDHPIYREALASKLTDDLSLRGITVVCVSCMQEAHLALSNFKQDWLVLLDLVLADNDPIANIHALLNEKSVRNLGVITGLEEELWETRAIAEGAHFFISKNHTYDFILTKISQMLNLNNLILNDNKGAQVVLTNRQLDVLNLIASGASNKLIALQLGISEQTVKIHIGAIFRSLNVTNRTKAVFIAKKLGVI